jgi:hypothetical protein
MLVRPSPIAKGCLWIEGKPKLSSSLLGYGEDFKIFLLLSGYRIRNDNWPRERVLQGNMGERRDIKKR